MPNIVGVKFREVGKVYYFDPKKIEFSVGDGVIVETSRGVEFGTIAIANRDVEDDKIVGELKSVIRKATEADISVHEKNLAKRDQALVDAKEKIAKHKLEMKLVDVEFAFDNSKVIFYFTADNRVDFRELVKDLAGHFKSRIELRQIGIRDECKLKGGLGPCGRACCCNCHLGDFERVSIKMAKNQGLSLNPTKISGLCGRLMCCLKYENDYYHETLKIMPKVGKEIETPEGKGVVDSTDILRQLVTVRFYKNGETSFSEFSASQLKIDSKDIAAVDSDNDDDASDVLPESDD